MRKIKKIIVHCSDSDVSSHDNIATIRKWHVEENGWRDVGYHYYYDKNGLRWKGRDETQVGSHVRGHNRDSIGLCVGGKYQFTNIQFKKLKSDINDLLKKYNLTWNDVYGHRDFDKSKTCPNFDIRSL